MFDPLRSGTVYDVPVKNPLASNGFRISPALGAEHWPRINEKIMARDPRQRWLRFCLASECACMGCANLWLTWAEYECWRKYDSETNKIRRSGEYQVNPALIVTPEASALESVEISISEKLKREMNSGVSRISASQVRAILLEDPPELMITTVCAPIERRQDGQ